MVYGYVRVSTFMQSREGNSIEEQTRKLKEYGCDHIVTEAFTGKTMIRPEFAKLIDKLQPGDTLVVCKFDRFARTTIDGVKMVKSLFDRGITVNVLNMGTIDNTPVGNLILTVMLAFSEYEREMIIERTQAGKSVARQSPNFHEGRPLKFTQKQKEHALNLLNSGQSYREVEELTGISKSTLIRYKFKKDANSAERD